MPPKKTATKRKAKEPLPPPSDENLNPEFTKLLQALSDKAKSEKDWMRFKAYNKAKDAIARFGAKIDDGNVKRLKELEGVGNGTVKRAQEFLETGQIADAMAFLNDPLENMKKQLEKVYGIGPKKASDLVEAGVRSLADLKTRHELLQSELSDAQRTALRFAREIVTPIKHSTAETLVQAVSAALKASDPKFSIEGVGAFRRQEATLSDSGLNLMVTHEDYTFDDPDNVANFRKKSAEENNQGPAIMRSACAALEAAGMLVAHIEGGHLKHSVLLMEKGARAKYDMPAPLMAPEGGEGGAAGPEVPAASAPHGDTSVGPAPPASGAGVAAAGLAIPDLDDAEDEAEAGTASTSGLWKKHGGLTGARAAASSSFGGRKRRADGPDVQLMDKAELEAAAKAAEEADELTPVQGPCPHMVVLHAVPTNFAGAARFFMTGPDDYVITMAREARKIGIKVGKYALREIDSIEFGDGSSRTIGIGRSAVLRPMDKTKKPKEVLGAELPVKSDEDVYAAIGAEYVEPKDRHTSTPVTVSAD